MYADPLWMRDLKVSQIASPSQWQDRTQDPLERPVLDLSGPNPATGNDGFGEPALGHAGLGHADPDGGGR